MRPDPTHKLYDATRVFLRGGGHFVGIIVQCQYNGAHGAYRYKIKSDATPAGYTYAWEYELSALFATGWADMVDKFIDELVAL